MTPTEFLNEVVRPNVIAFHEDFANYRHAFNAVASVDALAAHLYEWCKVNAPPEVAGVQDDTHFRGRLAVRSPVFKLLRDIAKAQKHVHLTQGKPLVTKHDQVTVRQFGYGRGGYGQGRYGGPQQIVVDTNTGDFEYVETVVDQSLEFLEKEIQRLGV
jgi:hypothetical protein